MPFGGWFDEYYERVYRSAIEDAGLVATRADDVFTPGSIIDQIVSGIRSARMLLADLTGRNPNVFYELGLAHAIAKPVILITDAIDDVPFDLRALRVLAYDRNDPGWGSRLRHDITRAIGEVGRAPIETVLPAFVRISSGWEPPEMTAADKAVLELRRDVALLRGEIQRADGLSVGAQRREYDDYEFQVRRYLRAGLGRLDIARRLIARGAPLEWVEREIERQQAQGVDPND